jgi:DNA-binding transcriptional regulator YdaS (Cro superfamily)
MARATVGRSVLQRLERKVGGSNALAERLGVRPTLLRRFLAGTLEVPDSVLVRALDLLAEVKRHDDDL